MWLQQAENRKTVPSDELKAVKDELQRNAVGIRGSDIFTITYSVMWNVSTIFNK